MFITVGNFFCFCRLLLAVLSLLLGLEGVTRLRLVNMRFSLLLLDTLLPKRLTYFKVT